MDNSLKRQIAKLDGHTHKLRDVLLGAHTLYAILKPMMTDKKLLTRISLEKRSAGFQTIRHALYWSLVMEVVKIVTDKDPRVPSILLLREMLTDEQVKAYLRKKFSMRTLPLNSSDQAAAGEFWKRFKDQKEKKLKRKFQSMYRRVMKESAELLKSRRLARLKKVRDKLLAHNELKYQNGSYEFIDIRSLGKYGDERVVLQQATRTINSFLALKAESFEWDAFMQTIKRDAREFWKLG